MSEKCLICGASITRIHLGIDACRACAVFYRRAIRSKVKIRCIYTGKCEQEGRLLECRRCRFDRMLRVFKRAGRLPEPRSSKKIVPKGSEIADDSRPEPALLQPQVEQPTTSSVPTRDSTTDGNSTPILDRIRCGYNVMCRLRKSGELCIRPLDKFVHPSEIDDDSYPIINATQNQHFRTMQILISSLFDFASIAFPEFRTLSKSEKWQIVSLSYFRMNIIDSTFRAMKLFPDDERVFASYTTTLSAETVDIFFSDSSDNVNSQEAIQAMRANLDATAGRSKRAMKKVDPTDEEFLAMIALSFWSAETDDEQLNQMATSCKNAIMHDLHVYYSTRGVANYAARIGELYCRLVSNEQVSSMILEDYEMFRLMGIYVQQLRF